MPTRCTDIEPLVQTYLDDELAEEDARDVERHIETCDGCRRRTVAQARFHAFLRKELAPCRAPESLRERVAHALDQEEWRMRRARRAPGRWVLPGSATVAAAAALLLFVVTAVQQPQTSEEPRVADDAVLQHMQRSPIEVQGAAVSPWVRRNYSGQVQMPRFEGVRTTLRGARRSQLRGRDAVQLYYDVLIGQRQHELSVHLFPAADIDFDRGFPNSRAYVVDGRVLWVGELRGHAVVAHRDASGTGYLFTSGDMRGEHLLEMVGRSDLLSPVP